ncbi:MAG: hypothetical protein KBF99_12715 [Leptospiraceae bacterium]|nr:hypothetical protein [Leptospiraceae bacterium]MBK9498446.1 hypothetical protein [Leptospiraceae bacterium]MBP9164040.1 hypothetical protein [Leptospiraceae bacterium]
MQPIRIVYKHLPDTLKIPDELKNKKGETIIWSLESSSDKKTKRAPLV